MFIRLVGEAISLCNKVIVLSQRPTTIINTHIIKLDNQTQKRNTEEFSYYYNQIWKEIQNDIK